MTEPKFKVGEHVRAFGVDGVVSWVDKTSSLSDAVAVRFENNQTSCFYHDGKYISWHKTPSLEFISRPKVKKKGWIGLVVLNGALVACSDIHESYEQAKDVILFNKPCSQIIQIEYEVET